MADRRARIAGQGPRRRMGARSKPSTEVATSGAVGAWFRGAGMRMSSRVGRAFVGGRLVHPESSMRIPPIPAAISTLPAGRIRPGSTLVSQRIGHVLAEGLRDPAEPVAVHPAMIDGRRDGED